MEMTLKNKKTSNAVCEYITGGSGWVLQRQRRHFSPQSQTSISPMSLFYRILVVSEDVLTGVLLMD